jgi:hypothetical protein
MGYTGPASQLEHSANPTNRFSCIIIIIVHHLKTSKQGDTHPCASGFFATWWTSDSISFVKDISTMLSREGVIKPLLNYLFLIHLLPHVSHPQSSHALNTSVPPMIGRIMKIGVTLTPHLSVAPSCHLKKAAQPLCSLHTPQKNWYGTWNRQQSTCKKTCAINARMLDINHEPSLPSCMHTVMHSHLEKD